MIWLLSKQSASDGLPEFLLMYNLKKIEQDLLFEKSVLERQRAGASPPS